MEPIPSNLDKKYPSRGPLQQYRFANAISFNCFRCAQTKTAKLITIYSSNWDYKLCNGCYGRLLSIYEIKTGSLSEDERVEKLAEILLKFKDAADLNYSERISCIANEKEKYLSAPALRFFKTAEYTASQLSHMPQLEWSPAIIGLCKAVEIEILHKLILPLAVAAKEQDLTNDKNDKDIGAVAAYCADQNRKPPTLGQVVHFIGTVANSTNRRDKSPLMRSFLGMISKYPTSTWILDNNGLVLELSDMTAEYRNKAAHIAELDKKDFDACKKQLAGDNGLLWKLAIKLAW